MFYNSGFYNYAWSPVEGCLNGCSYCYARKELKQQDKDFNPTFYGDRLIEPSKVRPCKIFVTYRTDLMGDFIPREWVEKVINECKSLPKHTFIFLTKNPIRYFQFDWPENCILGVTVEDPLKWWRVKIMEDIKNRKIVSIEPILGNFEGMDFSIFDQVIIGGLMGEASRIHPGWINSVKHGNIYYKPNVRGYVKCASV